MLVDLRCDGMMKEQKEMSSTLRKLCSTRPEEAARVLQRAAQDAPVAMVASSPSSSASQDAPVAVASSPASQSLTALELEAGVPLAEQPLTLAALGHQLAHRERVQMLNFFAATGVRKLGHRVRLHNALATSRDAGLLPPLLDVQSIGMLPLPKGKGASADVSHVTKWDESKTLKRDAQRSHAVCQNVMAMLTQVMVHTLAPDPPKCPLTLPRAPTRDDVKLLLFIACHCGSDARLHKLRRTLRSVAAQVGDAPSGGVGGGGGEGGGEGGGGLEARLVAKVRERAPDREHGRLALAEPAAVDDVELDPALAGREELLRGRRRLHAIDEGEAVAVMCERGRDDQRHRRHAVQQLIVGALHDEHEAAVPGPGVGGREGVREPVGGRRDGGDAMGGGGRATAHRGCRLRLRPLGPAAISGTRHPFGRRPQRHACSAAPVRGLRESESARSPVHSASRAPGSDKNAPNGTPSTTVRMPDSAPSVLGVGAHCVTTAYRRAACNTSAAPGATAVCTRSSSRSASACVTGSVTTAKLAAPRCSSAYVKPFGKSVAPR